MKIRDLIVKTQDGVVLVDDVSLDVSASGMILLGASGSGKSSMLHALAGLSNHQVEGGWTQPPTRVTLAVQQAREAFSVFRRIGPQVQESLGKAPAGQWREIMEGLEVADLERYWPHQLSGGMLKRILVGTVLVSGADVLLFDEPTSGVDPSLRWKVWQAIASCGVPWIAATHDQAVLGRYHDISHATLDGGRLQDEIHEGEP